MSRSCVLFGVDSVFSADVIETLKRLGFTEFFGVLTGKPEWDIEGVDAVCNQDEIGVEWLSLRVVVPWVTPALRHDRMDSAKQAGFRRFDPVIDPSAVVASNARIGLGVFVNAGSVIGAYASLAEGVTVNRNASVGHHTAIGGFAAIGPGVTVAARCSIGKHVRIGTGASVAPGISIGSNSVIALGAAVVENVPEGVMVAGVPAKAKRLADPAPAPAELQAASER